MTKEEVLQWLQRGGVAYEADLGEYWHMPTPGVFEWRTDRPDSNWRTGSGEWYLEDDRWREATRIEHAALGIPYPD